MIRKDENRSAEFLRLYEEGHTYASIGELYGVTRERVRQVLTDHMGAAAWKEYLKNRRQQKYAARKAAKEEKRLQLRTITEPEKPSHHDTIYAAYLAACCHTSRQEICEQLGITYGHLAHIIYRKRHNAPITQVRRTNSFNDAELKEIWEARLSGLSNAEVGVKFNLRLWQVTTVLKRAKAKFTQSI